ncbi:MAG: FIST C-terminal domain-containing protein [Lentisphaeraceae bacterium]|nr:FIST C-terminal domain-containing protein [Lentisphaeraceae bacterium]
MKWSTAFSDKEDFEESVRSCIDQIERQMTNEPDLIFVNFSPGFFPYAEDLSRALERAFPSAQLAGCGAGAMLSNQEELSDDPCLTLMVAELPNVEVSVHHVKVSDEPGEDVSPNAWRKYTGIAKKKNQSLILFADPYSEGVENVLRGLDYAYDATIIGGFSSGIQFKGTTALVSNEKVLNEGMVIVSLSGEIDVIPIVAQGCRAIGEDFEISECNETVLKTLGGHSPMLCLKKLADGLSDSDKELLHQSLFIGLEMDSLDIGVYEKEYLIRNIRGINPENGALVVGDFLQKGQTVRFHIRDPESSRAELQSIVDKMKVKLSSRSCKGMMLFSCLGRLADFYGEQSVDSGIVAQISETAPLGGFFCSGEFGQVNGSTYVHGYTASLALFYTPVK